MRLGAVDYLRKLTIKPSEILEVLCSIRDDFSEDSRENAAEFTNIQVLDDQLADIIVNNPVERSIDSKLDVGYSLFMDVDYPNKHFCTIKTNVFTSLIRQIVKSLGRDCCIYDSNESVIYAAILGSQDVGIAYKVREQVLATTDISLSIGVGPEWRNISDIRHSFDLAGNISHDRFYEGSGIIMVYKQEVVPLFSTDLFPAHYNMQKTLQAKKHNEIIEYIKTIFMDIRASRKYNSDMIKATCIEAFNTITCNLMNNSFESVKAGIFRRIMSSQTLDDLEEYFIGQIEHLMNKSNSGQSQVNSTIMKNALKFISENIYKDISLVQISRAISVSPSYLSMLFHKEVGENCNAYINKQKIEIAKQLLLEDNLIYEIAERLGFENGSYFSKVFKKYAGVTPEQYRGKNI